MPAWRMISTASSTLKAFTSSSLRCFIPVTIGRPREPSIALDTRRDTRVVELGGLGRVVAHVLGDLVVGVDGLHRTLGHAHGAVYALLGVDHEVVPTVVDAVNRAYLHASGVLRADTRFDNNVGHYRSSSPEHPYSPPVPTSTVTPVSEVYRRLVRRSNLPENVVNKTS